MPIAETETGGQAMQAPELIKAMIPMSAWRAMTPEARTVMTTYANKYPEKFTQTLKDPQALRSRYQSSKKAHWDNYQPAENVGSVKSTWGSINVDPSAARDTRPITHEAQHYLDRKRVAQTDPYDALTIGKLIDEVLPAKAQRGSLRNELDLINYLGGETPRLAGPMERYAQSPHIVRAAAGMRAVEQPKKISNYTGEQEGLFDILHRRVMDEGMAYLAQHSAEKDANPMAKLLADRLGLLPK